MWLIREVENVESAFYRLLIQCLCKYFLLLIDLLHLFLGLSPGSDTFGKSRTMASEKMGVKSR